MGYLELVKEVVTKKDVTTTTKPIRFETLHGVFEEALKDLGCREDAGILYFGEKDPNLLHKERKALSRVDEIWKACIEGRASLETFKDAVNAWHDAIIKLYTLQDQNV